ncbi:putative PI phosphatase [Pseudoneurospora amorphoporcata]|uniref:PI phosphatase n=1 Tax=Pseudoneurospora amorphoporcata TaxID=241081 RepID=A0AAN6SIM1_9PEZI|nr:putative PI phosphatase [Pseudoneurospora amorphoporcata]
MTPSTIDLFILTFNCAKNLINVAVWAAHLKAALSAQGAARKGTGNGNALPDVVVFSLQEVAPLAYSFIGPYFLNPYYARYAEALNLAAGQLLDQADDNYGTSTSSNGAVSNGGDPYTLVRAKNVGMTAILLFARDPSKIKQIEEAECGFGAADMGNKGAVGLRVTWSDGKDTTISTGEPKTTELTFVATHLAAMEWNLKKRNANWRSIVSGLTFANPREVLPKGEFPAESRAARATPDRSGAGDIAPDTTTQQDSSSSADADDDLAYGDDHDSDAQPLLSSSNSQFKSKHASALQSISIFKPSSHLFLAGDLNYRINTTTPPPLATYPSFDPSSPNHFPNFLPRDQLTQEREAGRTMNGLSEAPITFGPTYKYDVHPVKGEAVNEEAVNRGDMVNGVPEVPWRFASHRWPGWCDRVLYLDVPGWVREKNSRGVEVEAYDSLPVIETSDHRPVFFRASVPVLGKDEMRPPLPTEGGDLTVVQKEEEWRKDPRVSIPVVVDVQAWERRAAARKKEEMVGWTALFWSTKEGALVLATLLVIGVGSWWFFRDW